MANFQSVNGPSANTPSLHPSGIAGATSTSPVVLPAGLIAPQSAAFQTGSVALLVGSARVQVFNISSAATVTLPQSAILAGDRFEIINVGTAVLTINAANGSAITTLTNGKMTFYAAVATPFATSDWKIDALNARMIAGDTSGTVVPTGYVGESVMAATMSNQTWTAGGQFKNLGTLTLNKGFYLVVAKAKYSGPGTALVFANTSISLISATADNTFCAQDRSTQGAYNIQQQVIRPLVVSSDNTPIYLVGTIDYTGTGPTFGASESDFRAIRIA